jgi:cytochrome c oxidase subunit II
MPALGLPPIPVQCARRHTVCNERAERQLVRPNLRRAAAVAVSGLLALSVSGCSVAEWKRVAMPEPATQEGGAILQLWQGSWIAAAVIGVFTLALILWAPVAYRRRQGDPLPDQTRYNLPIEVLYTLAPLVVIATLFTFTVQSQANVVRVSGDQENTIGVIGFRWSWAFNYVEDNVYDVGSPGIPPTLVLPVGEKTQFTLQSPDVIHAFWIPAFVFKMDVIPGRVNVFEVTPDTVGTFAGKCTEFCGLDHARMLFNVRVVPRAEYEAHVADLRAKGQDGTFGTDRYRVGGAGEEGQS